MKKNTLSLLLFAGLIIIIAASGAGCTSDQKKIEASISPEESMNTFYDSQLANELGADDYGMRRYVMALLKAGPEQSQNATEARELQQAHMANIRRLANEGKLILAGPFLDEGEFRGIYIFDVTTIEEAHELTATDPAVQAGRLAMELHPWYGSAALLKVNGIHSRISKMNP